MTPEERAAFEAAILGGARPLESVPGPSAPMSLSMPQTQSFRDRVSGSPDTAYVPGASVTDRLRAAAGNAIDSGSRLASHPAVVSVLQGGPGVALGRYAADSAARSAGLEPTPGGVSPAELSRTTQAQLAAPQSEQPLQVQDTPVVQVQPAQTLGLDPRLASLPPVSAAGVGAGPGSLYSDAASARRQLVDAISGAGDLRRQAGQQEVARTIDVAALNEALAAKQQRDSEIQREEDERAALRHQSYLDESLRMSDEISKAKVTPDRFFRNATVGQQVAMGIGAVVGGMLSGLQGGPNQFLDRLDRYVDKDIQAQLQEIDNKKAALSQRNSVFGQMMQSAGDRRLAAMQYRNASYEAAKGWINARAQALGTPEALTRAEQAANEIDQRLAGMNYDWANQALAAYQANARAAAAARAAAEEKAWQRQMDLTKLGLEQDKLKIEAAKVQGDVVKDVEKEDAAALRQTAAALSNKDVAQNRALINSVRQFIKTDAQGNRYLPGFDTASRAKMGAAQAFGLSEPAAARVVLSEDDRKFRQAWQQLALKYQTDVTGSGGSAEQMEAIKKAFEGAGTMQERLAAVDRLVAMQDQLEANALAPLNERQRALWNQRTGREGAAPMPKSVTRK